MTVRERLRLLGELRAAGATLTVSIVALTLVERLIPAATAGATALVIDSAAPADRPTGTGNPVLDGMALALGIYGLVLLCEHALQAMGAPLRYAVRGRIDGRRRADVMRRTAACPTMEELERPETQERIRLARAEPGNWTESAPGAGALAVLAMFSSMLGVAASCLVVAMMAWWLVPVLVVPALLGRVLVSRYAIAYLRQWRAGFRHSLRADLWASMLSVPAAGKEVRLFGFAPLAIERTRRHRLDMFGPVWRVGLSGMRAGWYRFGITAAGLGTGYVVAVLYTLDGRATVATQAAVFAAGWSVFVGLFGYDPLPVLGALPGQRAYRELVSSLGSGDSSAERADRRPAAPTPARPPLVRFEAASFAYPGTDRLVLDRLDLEIRPGELLAVVGLNGAGKSTLIKLLAGLYRPTGGRITADGEDIWAIGVRRWRARLAVVFQDFARYPLPARDNVALGRARAAGADAAADAVLAEVAKEAGLDDVVDRLPAGWDTPLARSRRGGVDLSGGQWQTVALARALYAARAGADVLVLDEPTAHLDVRTEFEVFARLAARRGDQSVVLISHRLSTVRLADRIVLLRDGRIREAGSHRELMALGGTYARLFAIQAERFAGSGDGVAERLAGSDGDGVAEQLAGSDGGLDRRESR